MNEIKCEHYSLFGPYARPRRIRDGFDNNSDKMHGEIWALQRFTAITNQARKFSAFKCCCCSLNSFICSSVADFTPLFKSDYSVFGIFSAFETIAWFISVRNNICLFIHLFKVHMFIVLASNLLVASVCEHSIEPKLKQTETRPN